jgi:hypothetical protein
MDMWAQCEDCYGKNTAKRNKYRKKILKMFSSMDTYIVFFFFQREKVPEEYFKHDPEHKFIYRFVRTLFSAAQLTAECAIVTLVRYSLFIKHL